MKVTKAMSALPSAQSAGNNGPQLHWRDLTWKPVMSTDMKARMVMRRMRMRRKKHHNPMMNQRRMWRTEGIVGLTWEPVMSMNMKAKMATLRM